jgi:hypothetical protein
MSEAAIDRDLLCRGCGYNLRGLLPTGICPECAMDVAVSLVPSSLSLSEAKDFRLADAGTLMIIAVCCWEIVSKAGWILKLSHAAPGQLLWATNLVCSNPRMMVLISLSQVVALFAFSALARTQFRAVLFALGLFMSVMEIPFGIGNRWDKEITVLAQASIAVIYYPQWLGYAAGMAAAAGDELLANRFAILRWMVTAAVAVHLVGYLIDPVPMIAGDAGMILLSAWMIPQILRLRTALQRITPSNDWNGPLVPAPKGAPPDLASQGKHWLWRVRTGLLMECAFLGVALVFPMFSLVIARSGTFGPQGTASVILRGNSHATIRAAFFAVLGVAQLAFIWWISSPPWQERASASIGLRQWLRLLAVVALAGLLTAPLFAILDVGFLAASYVIRWLSQGAILFCLFLFIEKDLAVRAADEDVRWQAARLKWLLPLVTVGMTPLLANAVELRLIDAAAALALAHLIRMLGIVFDVWAIWLIYWLSRSFARALATPRNASDVI